MEGFEGQKSRTRRNCLFFALKDEKVLHPLKNNVFKSIWMLSPQIQLHCGQDQFSNWRSFHSIHVKPLFCCYRFQMSLSCFSVPLVLRKFPNIYTKYDWTKPRKYRNIDKASIISISYLRWNVNVLIVLIWCTQQLVLKNSEYTEYTHFKLRNR